MNDRIAKMTKTKNADSRKAVMNAMMECNASQEEPKLAVPTHRRKQHITFDEYKEMIRSGMTPQQVIERTSKHVVFFYNALLAGRITLGKDEFEREYLSGMSLDEIAAKHGIPRTHVTYLREFYGIKRKGYTFQKRLSNEVPLSDEAKSIIVGSILGDGHIHPLGYWSEKHCIAQADYLRWKASFVPDITTEKSFTEYKAYDKRSNKSHRGLSFRTRAHSWLYELGGMFYRGEGRSRVKVIPGNIVDLLDEQAFAIWFMDDGNTDWGYRKGKKWYGQRPLCTIHTESFTFENVARLCKCLKSKFNLRCKPCKKGGTRNKQPVIRFDAESSSLLTKMLGFYAVECMKYKFFDKFVTR